MSDYIAIAQINESLYHHGILGQKWGVRRFQNPDGSLTSEGRKRYSSSTPPNTKFLKNYDGPAYFISSNDSLKNLNPRVPDNFFTKNGYEDSSTPRVSFAPSVDKCLAGLSQNVEGKEFTVYKPKDVRNHKIFKPNKKAVPDSAITDELWICEPVELEKVGTLKVTGNKGSSGKNFSYGNHEATLYDDWTYEMNNLNHSDADNFLSYKGIKRRRKKVMIMGDYVAIAQVDDSLYHHGINGQKWGVRRFQNSDGSLTEEGRRRYGRNGGIMSINTKERLKQGAKIGAKVGAGVGALGTALSVGSLAAAGVAVPPAAIAAIGGTYLASYATTGALRGALYGTVYGAVETHQVRQFMRNEDNMNVKIKDLN